MSITVLGAAGATGRRIVAALLADGHTVRAGVRRPDSAADLRAAGADILPIDLTSSGAELASSLSGTTTVINAAAARNVLHSPEVDGDGVIRCIDAAQRVGVRRWVQVSMAGVDALEQLPGVLQGAGQAKKRADDHLGGSALTWTVVRPPWLTDRPGTGRVAVDGIGSGELSRVDLAALVIASIDLPVTYRRAFMVGGGDTRIADALRSLAD